MRTQAAIDHFGGVQKLAAALGITRGAVYLWGSTVPELRQYQLERITDGALKADSPRSSAVA